jgi:hypothetical protein
MGLYKVTCTTTTACPEDATLSHVEQVGLDGPEGAEIFDVGVARLMLSSGDTITVGARGDEDAEIRKGKCPACGAPTLRGRKSDPPLDLSTLQPC